MGRRPETGLHPSIADADRKLRRVGVVVAADVAGGAEALAGFKIERDQRLVANVIDRRPMVREWTKRRLRNISSRY